MITNNRRSKWEYFLFLIPIILYISLAAQYIWLPGIYYDEVLGAVPAIAAVEKGVQGPYIQVEGSVIHLGDRPFPLMILPYLGSFQTAILIPVFALINISVPVMRGTFIFLGAVGLLGTYVFTTRFFNRSVALVAAILLAVDPTFIFATRSDNGPTSVMMICKMGVLWLLLLWWQRQKSIFLLLGAFVAGLGVYDKLNFVWFLGALGAATFMIFPTASWQRLKRVKWYTFAAAGISFFAGSSIFWLYTIVSGGGVFRGIANILFRQTAFGVENTAIFQNLFIRLESFIRLLNGNEILSFYLSTFENQTDLFWDVFRNGTILPELLFLALFITLIQMITRFPFGMPVKKILFLALLTLIILVASIVTPTNFMYHHLLVAYPFPHLMIACFLVKIPHMLQKVRLNPRIASSAGSLVLLITLGISLSVVQQYYRTLNETGGKGMWSNVIYDLAGYLEDDARTVVSMDWGINLNLLMLSSGEFNTLEVWQNFIYTSEYSLNMESLVTRPETVFVFHAPEFSGIYKLNDFDGPRMTFFNTVEAIGYKPVLEREFSQSDGKVLFELYTVAPGIAQEIQRNNRGDWETIIER